MRQSETDKRPENKKDGMQKEKVPPNSTNPIKLKDEKIIMI